MQYKSIIKLAMTSLIISILSGCASYNEWKQKVEKEAAASRAYDFEHSSDKNMLSQFYFVSNDGRDYGVVSDLKEHRYYLSAQSQGYIVLQRKVNSSLNLGEAAQDMPNHASHILDDPAAKKFVSAAKKRGDKVRLYKPNLAKAINFNIVQAFGPASDRSSVERYDLSNVLIAYNRNNEIVAFITKAYQASLGIGADTTEYTNIHFGNPAARVIENNIQNGLFSENFIRDL